MPTVRHYLTEFIIGGKEKMLRTSKQKDSSFQNKIKLIWDFSASLDQEKII